MASVREFTKVVNEHPPNLTHPLLVLTPSPPKLTHFCSMDSIKDTNETYISSRPRISRFNCIPNHVPTWLVECSIFTARKLKGHEVGSQI